MKLAKDDLNFGIPVMALTGAEDLGTGTVACADREVWRITGIEDSRIWYYKTGSPKAGVGMYIPSYVSVDISVEDGYTFEVDGEVNIAKFK